MPPAKTSPKDALTSQFLKGVIKILASRIAEGNHKINFEDEESISENFSEFLETAKARRVSTADKSGAKEKSTKTGKKAEEQRWLPPDVFDKEFLQNDVRACTYIHDKSGPNKGKVCSCKLNDDECEDETDYNKYRCAKHAEQDGLCTLDKILKEKSTKGGKKAKKDVKEDNSSAIAHLEGTSSYDSNSAKINDVTASFKKSDAKVIKGDKIIHIIPCSRLVVVRKTECIGALPNASLRYMKEGELPDDYESKLVTLNKEEKKLITSEYEYNGKGKNVQEESDSDDEKKESKKTDKKTNGKSKPSKPSEESSDEEEDVRPAAKGEPKPKSSSSNKKPVKKADDSDSESDSEKKTKKLPKKTAPKPSEEGSDSDSEKKPSKTKPVKKAADSDEEDVKPSKSSKKSQVDSDGEEASVKEVPDSD